MNHSDHDSLQRMIDRLVDGELSPAQSRALLLRLDQEPAMWRRCALAFIEAQAMRSDLAELCSERASPAPSVLVVKPPVSGQGSVLVRRGLIALAMAASFAVALPLGRWLLPAGPKAPIALQRPIVEQVAPSPAAAAMASASPQDRPLGKVQFVTEDGQFEVPYYDMQAGARYLRDEPGEEAASIIEALEREGHHVERTPSVLPVQLDNGAQVYLPVDNYRITPVSNRSIQ